ncbi:MAG: protein-L-isoaspartate(D-aspartate) O-methyltransferase [Acidobacteriota bacterium]
MSDAKQRLLDEIADDVRGASAALGRDRLSPGVLRAIEAVPREALVDASLHARAYVNRPLPIGAGQTISQPLIVAVMSDLIDPEPNDRVLEIGTGSGYQAAVLAELVAEVYTIEIIDALGREARRRLDALGYTNIRFRLGDGGAGWPAAAPFEGIVVTAACPTIPLPWIEQLAPGGRMILPLADGRGGELLTVVSKRQDGTVDQRAVLAVRFVPLTGEHGHR